MITEKGEKTKIILLHFEEGDPENPLNWSLARKWFTVSPPPSPWLGRRARPSRTDKTSSLLYHFFPDLPPVRCPDLIAFDPTASIGLMLTFHFAPVPSVTVDAQVYGESSFLAAFCYCFVANSTVLRTLQMTCLIGLSTSAYSSTVSGMSEEYGIAPVAAQVGMFTYVSAQFLAGS